MSAYDFFHSLHYLHHIYNATFWWDIGKYLCLYPDQTTHTGASAQGIMTIQRWYFFRGSFVFLCLMFLMLSRLFIAALCSPAGKGLTSWLFLVMFIVFLLLSNLVSWDRCGAWLYRFLINAVLFTFKLFAYKILYQKLNKDENTIQQPLQRKWTGPIDRDGKIHSV